MQPDQPTGAMRLMAKFNNAKAVAVREIELRTKRHRVMVELFLGADGEMTPNAEWFFTDVARLASFYSYGFENDARFQDFMQGQRALLSDMLAGFHLDAERLRQLHNNLERTEL
jgi:hypothetical protein